jgi:6-phosphogluconolactonase (cycloisomerase 2 family)
VRRLLILALGIFLIAPQIAQACSINWTGNAGDGYWTTPGNWDLNRLPNSNDSVCIASGFVVNTVDGKNIGTILSLTLDGSLTLNDVSTILTDASATSTIYNLTLNGPSTASVLTVNGTANFTGTLTLSDGAVQGEGTATLAGTVNVLKDNCSITPYTLTNQGKIVVSGSLQLTLGTVSFVNAETGSIDLQADGITVLGGATFDNLGSIAKSMGTGTSTLSLSGAFNNAGKIEAQSGTLQLAAFFTNNGAFSATSGATLQFANVVTLNEGTTFGGSGTMDITAGGVWDVETPITVDSRSLHFDGATGTIIRGNSNLTVNSEYVTWNSGVIGAQTGSVMTLSKAAKMAIVSTGYHGLAMTLDLLGTVNMEADLNLSESTVTIEANAEFNITTDNGIHGGGTINNGGIFEKIEGKATSTLDYTGTFNIDAPKGSNPVTVSKGTLNFALVGGGVLGDIWTVGSHATLEFTAGNYTLPEGSEFTGSGFTELHGASWDLTGNVSVSTYFFMVSSTISGAWDLTLLGRSISLSGARTGVIVNKKPVGTIKIPGAHTLVDVFSTLTLTLDACTLDNSSSLFDVGGTVVVQDSAALLNKKGGTISLDNLNGGQAIQVNSGIFVNLGKVAVNEGSQTIGGTVPWENDGKLDVPLGYTLGIPAGYVNLGGVTQIKGGTVTIDGTADFEGGTLDGTGSVNGTAGINNEGATVEAGIPGTQGPGASTGILNLNVPLTQGSGAAITALISGTTVGTQYDQINGTSSVALAGTLNLQFGNGFTPTPTDTFNILNFSAVTGNFATVNAPTGWTAQLKFTATALNVQFTKNGLSVSISPKAAMLNANETTQFTGTVVGASKNGEKWSVKESGGGTVTQTGLYAAPATPGTYHVVVTSVADATKSDTATVTVTAADAGKLTVTPQAAVLQPGAVLTLQANQSVAWSVAEGRVGGRVTAGGSYTAPRQPGLYHVVATDAEGSNHAVANIAVTRGKLESAYVANLDKNAVSVLAGLTGDGLTTGPLQETGSLAAGQGPVALAISPDGKLLLSANQNSNDISLFALSHGDNALSVPHGTSFASGAQPSSVAFDPTGRFVFVTNQRSDDLSVFSVDASGQLIFVRSHSFAAGAKPSAIAVHPDGSVLYVTNAGTNTVQGFAYDPTGRLKPLSGSPTATGKSPSAAVIDSAGKFLFVANRGSGDVSVFAIDGKSETLQEVKGSPFKTGRGAAAIAIDLTGCYLFVADHQANDIASFQINNETGVLTLLGRTPLLSAGPSALAMDPSGQYLHVTSDKTGGVTTLRLDFATGRLAPAGETATREKASSIVVGSAYATGPY